MLRHARECAAAAAIVLSLFLIASCGAPSGDKSGGSGPKREAPDVTVSDLDGRAVRLADYAGKVRIVDFWATWCAPCREEIPHFKELHQKYGDKGFVLIAISMDEEGAKVVRPFVEAEKIPYLNLVGNDDVAEAFGGIVGLPTAFVIDRDNRIVATYVGGTPKGVFEKQIRNLLGLGAAS